MGGGEVAAADFLAGMAETGAAEGFGVAGTGLTAAELGTTAGAAAPSLLSSGAGTAGGISSLSPALQTAISNTAAVNAPVAAQAMQAAAAGAVPSAATALGAGQIGDLAATDMSLGAAGEANAQAANEAYRQASSAAAMPGITPGTAPLQGPALPAVPNVTPGFGPGSTAIPIQDAAFTPPVEGMLDAATGKMPTEPGLGGLLSKGYEAWKDSNPFIKYGLPGLAAAKYMSRPTSTYAPPGYSGPLSKFSYDPSTYTPYTYKPYAAGGTVEQMSRENALGANTGYPQADINQGAYATPWQTPVSRNVVTGPSDANVDQMTGEERLAGGGIASLGSYSDGGRLLRGPGDGMSDGIPATISGKQPARLADGEFVVPADVVSGLGNGSTDAGAKHLYSMMDKVRQARTGTKKQGKEINPRKYMPT